MNKYKKSLCRTIMLLDYIPRYGRVYVFDRETRVKTRKWIWFSPGYGLWGFYPLNRIGWLHEYMDTWELKERNISEDGQVG